MAPFTTSDEILEARATLNTTFKGGLTKSIAWRKWQLKQVWWMVCDHEKAIASALHKDLHRHDFETHIADIGGVKADILNHLDKVEGWAADDIPDAGFLFGTLGKARIRKEPLGVALIIGPWNFPFNLTLLPLIAAISAGCCVMVKPSEVSGKSPGQFNSLLASLYIRKLYYTGYLRKCGNFRTTAVAITDSRSFDSRVARPHGRDNPEISGFTCYPSCDRRAQRDDSHLRAAF